MHEECGICGAANTNASPLVYRMLLQMQHRGQLSAGITSFHPNEKFLLRTHKDLGLVSRVFHTEQKDKFENIMKKHASPITIGHVRYATSGTDDREYAQPFERMHGRKGKWFSIAFNGNIANYSELKARLEKFNYHLVHETDTEVLMHLFARALKKTTNLVEVFKEVSSQADGAYCIAFIDAEGTMIASRDPLGLKPLCFGVKDNEIAFASESVALNSIGFDEIKDIAPGEMLIVKNGKYELKRYTNSPRSAHCFFEWVYFAHPASKIDGKLVYEARHSLGKELAKLENQKIDSDCIVVPVPDSSTPFGEGFSDAMKIPLREGLIRNRYLGRTFIEPKNRAEKVRDKFVAIRDVMENKRIFLVEDSIVRGTTLKNLVEFIRKNGRPKEIHVRVSCPPIMWPCFYGIDMSTKKELIAPQVEKVTGSNKEELEKAIAKELNVDSLIYQSEEGLINALSKPSGDLCLACINGNYPTKSGEKLKFFCGEGRAQETIDCKTSTVKK